MLVFNLCLPPDITPYSLITLSLFVFHLHVCPFLYLLPTFLVNFWISVSYFFPNSRSHFRFSLSSLSTLCLPLFSLSICLYLFIFLSSPNIIFFYSFSFIPSSNHSLFNSSFAFSLTTPIHSLFAWRDTIKWDLFGKKVLDNYPWMFWHTLAHIHRTRKGVSNIVQPHLPASINKLCLRPDVCACLHCVRHTKVRLPCY